MMQMATESFGEATSIRSTRSAPAIGRAFSTPRLPSRSRAGERDVAKNELQTASAASSEGSMEERILVRWLLVVQSGDARLRQLGRKLNYQLTCERDHLDRVVD